MDTIKLIAQKIKGETQLIRGRYEISMGHHFKGGVSKLRGRAILFESYLKSKK